MLVFPPITSKEKTLMSKPATTVDLAAFKKQLADSLERSAKTAGHTIIKESLTCEMAIGLQVVTAPIKRGQSLVHRPYGKNSSLVDGPGSTAAFKTRYRRNEHRDLARRGI
jgi:hypothetical protein